MDRRTVEKVVGAVAGVLGVGDDGGLGEVTDGSELDWGEHGRERDRGGGGEGELGSLEVVAWDGPDADEVCRSFPRPEILGL